MKKLAWLIALAGLTPAVLRAIPITLSFAPPSQTAMVGQTVAVDVVIAGLVAGAAPTVGAFDLDVSFNNTILAPTGVTFGPYLGDPALLEALISFSFLPGVVDLAEVSLLTTAALDALQPASFVLATLVFDVIGRGTSPLTFSQIIVDDAFGEKLSVSGDTGSVMAVAVPEPGTFLLLTLGVSAWIGLRRRPIN